MENNVKSVPNDISFSFKANNTNSYRETLEFFCASLKEELPAFSDDAGNQTALFLLTPDSGVDASTNFWGNALENTPAFANPIEFPFTLSNSSASEISRALNIRGPNYTLCGGLEEIDSFEEFISFETSENKSYIDSVLVLYVALKSNIQCTGSFLHLGKRNYHRSFSSSIRWGRESR